MEYEVDLEPKKIDAAILLSQGMSGKEVAEKVGVTAQTMVAWKRLPDFELFMNELKLYKVDAIKDGYQELAYQAITTFRDLMAHSNLDETRRKAAKDTLEMLGFFEQPMQNFAVFNHFEQFHKEYLEHQRDKRKYGDQQND